MIMFEYLLPEEFDELKESVKQPEGLKQFRESVKALLTTLPNDGGAFSDTIYIAGKRLTQKGVLAAVSERDIASATMDAPVTSLRLFLETAPRDYTAGVLRFREAAIRDDARAVLERPSHMAKRIIAKSSPKKGPRVEKKGERVRVFKSKSEAKTVGQLLAESAIERLMEDDGVVVVSALPKKPKVGHPRRPTGRRGTPALKGG